MATERIEHFAVTEKPWGKEVLIDHTGHYALKEIWVKAGSRTSLQSHLKKLETILVLHGKIELETADSAGQPVRAVYTANQAYSIQPGAVHRVTALDDCRMIEVSTPEVDDVVRHQDDYGR